MPFFTVIADKNKTEREYAWGKCRLKDRNHSDFMLLKELVIKEHKELMRKKAHNIYETNYRKPRFAREFGGGLVPPVINYWCIHRWDQVKSMLLGDMETLPRAELVFVFLLGSQLVQVLFYLLSWFVTDRVGNMILAPVVGTVFVVAGLMVWELFPRFTREAARLKLEQHRPWEIFIKVLGWNRAVLMIISLGLGVVLGFWPMHSFVSSNIMRATESRLHASAVLCQDREQRIEQLQQEINQEKEASKKLEELVARLDREKEEGAARLQQEINYEKEASKKLEELVAAVRTQGATDVATCRCLNRHLEQKETTASKMLVDTVVEKVAAAVKECDQRLKQEQEAALMRLKSAVDHAKK